MSASYLPDYQELAPDGTAIYATDKQTLTRFKVHPELSQHKSKLAGMPVFDDVEVIEMRIPGEKEPVIVPANEFHKRRFPREYEAFKKGKENQSGGTPLELLFPSSPSTVKQLQAFHIFSIQQLANITDNAISQIPMGQTLVDRARDYMKKAGEGQNFHQMKMMEEKIAQLEAQISERPKVETPAKRGPGRPKKVIEQKEPL